MHTLFAFLPANVIIYEGSYKADMIARISPYYRSSTVENVASYGKPDTLHTAVLHVGYLRPSPI